MGRVGCSSVVFVSTNLSLECGGATIVVDGVVVSKEEEDLVARARALLSDAEPAPAPTRVEPVEDDDLDIDMDLIRRARALRGASQLARTESK